MFTFFKGDSGGPLQIMQDDQQCTYTQIGITSFGPRDCGRSKSPAVYTRVAYYIEWIQKIVWPADSTVWANIFSQWTDRFMLSSVASFKIEDDKGENDDNRN